MLRLCERLRNEILYLVFRFEDRWHVSQGWYCRRYKHEAVRLVSGIRPRRVVDLGSGLGDILLRIPAEDRLGLDIDNGVVRACRLIAGRRAKIELGSWGALVGLPSSDIDCLIMLGWTHRVPFQELRKDIERASQRHCIRYWLVDEYREGKDPGGFLHNTAALFEGIAVLRLRSKGDETRDLLLYESKAA